MTTPEAGRTRPPALSRRWLLPCCLALLATVPAMALDFHSWRTDGQQVRLSSVNHQSSNQAFNLYEDITDTGSATYAQYWVNELQENGGLSNPPFGDVPPTVALRDNRQQDVKPDWASWISVTQKVAPPARPLFSPDLPKAWGPVVADIQTGAGYEDHFLLMVSFEPSTVGGVNDRKDQILNAYYPQTADGLPNNDQSLGGADRFAVRPFWVRGNNVNAPGLRIRDLEPVRNEYNNTANPQVAVVTQPPIFARVPAQYELGGGNVATEVIPVVYLVVGTGENGEFARVICLALDQPGQPDFRYLPDPNNTNLIQPVQDPPDPDFFNPNTGSGGAVLWSYVVRARGGVNAPTPVAGISFANVGDQTASLPLLFLTTADGQIICLNAKGADTRPHSGDGDPALLPVDDVPARWIWETPTETPAVGMPVTPGFLYGMAPAVARVPLTGMFPPNTPGTANTVANALTRHGVDEYALFVADTYGNFRCFEAPGRTVTNAMGGVIRQDPLLRWIHRPQNMVPGDTPRLDQLGNPERFITPPVVYQGNTPLRTSNGAIVSGSADVGFDDQVLFPAERGRLYVLDALGMFNVDANPNVDGTPTGATHLRFRFPEDDTHTLANAANSIESPYFPRELPDPQQNVGAAPPVNNPALLRRTIGDQIPFNDRYFSRSALAVGLGANTNPNGGNPNLDIGDDQVFVPYLQEQPATIVVPGPGNSMIPVMRPANSRWFYEYVGAMKPYGFIQVSHPITQLTGASFVVGMTTVNIPIEYLRVGTVKGSGLPSNRVQTVIGSPTENGPNENFSLTNPTPDDTVYFTTLSWYDSAINGYRTLPFGTQVTLTYDGPTDANDTTPISRTETLTFPSCYRQYFPDPDDLTVPPVIVRDRASLTDANNRLEQRRFIRQAGNMGMGNDILDDEFPAVVPFHPGPSDSWQNASGEGARQPSMFAAGSASLSGTLMAPSFFRGRVICFSHRLRLTRILFTGFHPFMRTGGAITPPFGPPGRPNTYDPGLFFTVGMGMNVFGDDQPLLADVGSSVSLIDGWAYVTLCNGHLQAYANTDGGGTGTVGGQPPYFQLPPPSGTLGNLVRAPGGDPNSPGVLPGAGFYITDNPNDPTDTTRYINLNPNLDLALLLEWGQTFFLVVDFGPANELAPPQSVDPNRPITLGGGNDDLDGQVLQNEVQAQIRSQGAGAVQQLPGLNRGVRPSVISGMGGDRVMAVIPVFCGVPSPTNPLTPGTPLLWEKQSSADQRNNNTGAPGGDGQPDNEFQGELTYDLQVTQQGLQWRWPNDAGDPYDGNPRANKQHYWEAERNQANVRFPTSGGTTNGLPGGPARWSWRSEWAPLVSYNNPITLAYDPDGQGGAPAPPPGPSFPTFEIGTATQFTNRLDPDRKNGDRYANAPVDGARSGAGEPVVPVVGAPIVGSGRRQLLFAEHGKTTAVSKTDAALGPLPDLARVRVGDRSWLAFSGRNLNLRVQAAPLTKLGRGAWYGTVNDASLANLPGAPVGSFEQNINVLDDSPSGLYSSIPSSRIKVTKSGTALDLANGPISVVGRSRSMNATPIDPGTVPLFPNLDPLDVQVDIPLYQPDDIYATRWRRQSSPQGATNADGFNPFSPGPNFRGESPLPMFDRAEKLSRPGSALAPPLMPVAEDPGPDPSGYDPRRDDRFRRVVIFNDANNNGVLDLNANYREAYRTFAFQVAVKPEMKIEAQQQLVDLGSVWHGKKQPGMPGGGANEIREWQYMTGTLLAAAPGTPQRAQGEFYRTYWKRFNLLNSGNVNLAYVKPEVAYQTPTAGVQLIGWPSEGNDPWRALSLINATSAAALADPFQIFLRTSFDDQLLPTAAAAYGAGDRGVWLQKAPSGSSQPGAVAYAAPNPTGSTAAERDPSAGGLPRETFLAINLPTGSPLGQYGGSLRFFNDRGVTLIENSANPLGFVYARPEAALGLGVAARNGTLDRQGQAQPVPGEPVEPVTDPPLKTRVRVTENLVSGRHATEVAAADPDRRIMPAAMADASQSGPSGQVGRILTGYVSNLNGLVGGNALQYDLMGTLLTWDPARMLFEFDPLPRVRGTEGPWRDFTGAIGWSQLTPALPNVQVAKPSFFQDLSGEGYAAWTERESPAPGQSRWRIRYRQLTAPGGGIANPGSPPLEVLPYNLPLDPNIQRSGVKMVPARLPTGATDWFAFYSAGSGARRNLAYTRTEAIGNPSAWLSETVLPSAKGMATVNDPYPVVVEPVLRAPGPLPPGGPNEPPVVANERTALPDTAWVAYSGSSQTLGRTDVYLSRYRLNSLRQAGQRGVPNLQGRAEDFAQVGWQRIEGDVLKGNAQRTRYLMGGADLLVRPYSQVEVWIGRPDAPFGSQGSLQFPIPLIGLNNVGTNTTDGEIVFQLNTGGMRAGYPFADPNLRAIAALQRERVIVDPTTGVARLTTDARTLARLIWQALGLNPPLTQASPDPVLTADFTCTTLRVTSDGVSGNDPVVVPVLPGPNQAPVMDASWYRQQIDPGKWTSGLPVAARADRVWLFWRRAQGVSSSGPTCYYKVLRPGIRVRTGNISRVDTLGLQVAVGQPAQAVLPEEVNPVNGQIYFPYEMEGQPVQVTYFFGNLQLTEVHRIGWLDESGEQPVPMETSVNEGSLDGFVGYEDVLMTSFGSQQPAPFRHMERIWLFWGTTRGSGGDVMFGTLAPRIGPEVNVNGSVTLFQASRPAFATGRPANQVRQAIQDAALLERRRPFTVPGITRRGPYLPRPAVRPARGARR